MPYCNTINIIYFNIFFAKSQGLFVRIDKILLLKFNIYSYKIANYGQMPRQCAILKAKRRISMPRREENIYKRKDGRWEARYVKEIAVDGSKKYGSVYARTYRKVKAKQRVYTLVVQIKL